MTKFALVAGVLTAGMVLAACSSSSSGSSYSGTETIVGTATGSSAANQLNSNNSNAPLTLHSLVFRGPVNTSVTGSISLGGQGTTHTFVTPAGNLTVSHTQPGNEEEPAITGKSGNLCYFKGSVGSGTYSVEGSQSTGKFAGATGHGTFTITLAGAAQLQAGQTSCNINNLGNTVAKGASITFHAEGPLTVKS